MLDGKYKEAAELFQLCLKENGEHPGIRYNLGLSYECCCEFLKAREEYVTVIEMYPTYVPAYLCLANLSMYDADIEESERILSAVRVLDPKDARAALLLSEIHCLQGRFDEGIKHHHEAVDLVDETGSLPTNSHVVCYMWFGENSPKFHMFFERSLLHRGNILPPFSVPDNLKDMKIVMVAHTGTADDVARRMHGLARDRVFLVTLDELSATILADYAPDLSCTFAYQMNEVPTIQLYVASELLKQGVACVLVPAEDGRSDATKLAWAEGLQGVQVNRTGDLVAFSGDEHAISPFRVPPLLYRGQHAPSDIFCRIFREFLSKV